MQKRKSLRRAALISLASLALIAAGAAPSRASDSCIIPPSVPPTNEPFARQVWNELRLKRAAQNTYQAFALASGSEQQTPSAIGSINALVILVDFDDNVATRPNYVMKNVFFGSSQESPAGSVAQYYAENSYGKFQYNGIVFGDPRPNAYDNPDPAQQVKWIRMPHYYEWYANDAYGEGSDPQNSGQLTKDALDAVQSLYPNYDWSQFDKNGDGFIDLLYIVIAGTGAESTANPAQIWSHEEDLSSDYVFNSTSASGQPLKARKYAMGSETSDFSTHAHESGHVLGLPDLYTNPQGQSVGLGYWSIMAAGTNIAGRPSDFDAWSKIQLGWITPTVITKSASNLTLAPVETNPVALKMSANPNNPQEYFLIENREPLSGTYDAPFTVSKSVEEGGLPGAGIIIYHVDDSRSSNDDRGHLKVMIEEADAGDLVAGTPNGYFNLLMPFNLPESNYGDSGDPFGSKHASFTDQTTPSSYNYDAKDSGVRITNIAVPATTSSAVQGLPIVDPASGNATLSISVASVIGTVFTANGAKLPAYTVDLLTSDGQPIASPKTVINGAQFTINDLDNGEYELQIKAAKYIPQIIPFTKGDGPYTLRLFLASQPSSSSFAKGWNLVTFPYVFSGAKVSDVLGVTDLVAYGWDGSNYVTDPVTNPGKAYWVYLTDASQFQIAIPGIAVTPESTYTVPIKTGWNLIGNPFPMGFTWLPSQITLNANGASYTLDAAANVGVAQSIAWLYNPSTSSYKLLSIGDPVYANEGFWYKSAVDGTLVFPAPAVAQ